MQPDIQLNNFTLSNKLEIFVDRKTQLDPLDAYVHDSSDLFIEGIIEKYNPGHNILEP